MKQILRVTGIILMLMLSGCTVSPSVLGNNIAGIGSGAAQQNQASANMQAANAETSLKAAPDQSADAPGSTGSIVPLSQEGAVVDLPDSSTLVAPSATFGQAPTSVGDEGVAVSEDEQAFSAAERHRRELINRGDLQEGQPLPAE